MGLHRLYTKSRRKSHPYPRYHRTKGKTKGITTLSENFLARLLTPLVSVCTISRVKDETQATPTADPEPDR